MYNIRYHIASLVAVFLALALGLVLGGLVVRQGGFDAQQSAIVASLQKDFNKIKQQNTTLKNDLTFEQGYSAQMTNHWIAGRLSGRSVVVITNAKNAAGDAAISAVKDAGGNAAVVTMAKPEFGTADKAVAAQLRSILGTSTDLQTAVPSTLASEWSQPDVARPVTDALQNAGVITITGLSASMGATQVVDVAAFDGKPDALGARRRTGVRLSRHVRPRRGNACERNRRRLRSSSAQALGVRHAGHQCRPVHAGRALHRWRAGLLQRRLQCDGEVPAGACAVAGSLSR